MLSDHDIDEIAKHAENPLPGNNTFATLSFTTTCMNNAARELLDQAVAERMIVLKISGKIDQDAEYLPQTERSVLYWLFRWSGIIDPVAREQRDLLLAELQLYAEQLKIVSAEYAENLPEEVAYWENACAELRGMLQTRQVFYDRHFQEHKAEIAALNERLRALAVKYPEIWEEAKP